MRSIKINFLKLLKSTAMTLLFIPGVSAMEDDLKPKVPSSSFRKMPSSTSRVTPSLSSSLSLECEQIDEPQKLYLFEGKRLIKGEVPNDGTCFLYTLDMLFPGRGISRDEFAARLNAASVGRSSSVSADELRQEFAIELYSQFYQLAVGGGALGFKGNEIDNLSENFVKNMREKDVDQKTMFESTTQIIAADDEIIKEMLVAYAQTGVYLSLPVKELGNIGSFGLACKLFGLNLDVYSPKGQTNQLDLWEKFPFGRESPPQAALYEPVRAHVSPLCLEGELETRKRFAENEIKMMLQKSGINSSEVSGSALQSDPLSFTKTKLNVPFGSYLSSRLNVGTSAQYGGIYLPQVPVIHPYTMSAEEERTNFGVPSFPYAVRLSAEELNPNLFPVFFKTQETLRNLGIHLRDAEYFYIVQHDPWNAGPWPTEDGKYLTERLLRPQYWLFQDVPASSPSIVNRHENIKVEISSPNNAITLTGPSEGVVSSHNAVSKENPNGDPLVISSGPDFPMLSGLKANQTSFFVSTVVNPRTKSAAVTFHTILSDDDFGLLKTATLNNLSDLQFWLAKLYQSKPGAISDSSSPYSSWTTEVLSASSMHSLTFRTTGTKEGAEIKHSAIYASFSYQNNPDAAYSLIINHRTKDKGSEVRVFNPNTKTYIDLGRLSPSMGFSDQIFNLSSLFKGAPSSSSDPSIMRTELNFIDGISDIHSFTIKSGEERLMEVILGDQESEKQAGVYVYAPEVSEKLQEWSEVRSEDVQS